MQLLIGEEWCEVLEAGTQTGHFGVIPVHGVNALERGVLLVRCGRTVGALQNVTLTQAESANSGDGDVAVVRTGRVALDAQEAVAVVTQIQDAFDLNQLTGVVHVGVSLGFATTLEAITVAVATVAVAIATSIAVGVAAIAVKVTGLTWFARFTGLTLFAGASIVTTLRSTLAALAGLGRCCLARGR